MQPQRINSPIQPTWKFEVRDTVYYRGDHGVVIDRKAIVAAHASVQTRYLVEFDDDSRIWMRETDLVDGRPIVEAAAKAAAEAMMKMPESKSGEAKSGESKPEQKREKVTA